MTKVIIIKLNSMEILSISISKEDLKSLESAQKRLGFNSRSKMLRSAIESLINDYDKLNELKGNTESVFVLTYPDSEKNKVSDMLHRFEEDINSEMHHHHHHTCIDILSLHTGADEVRRFFKEAKSNKSVRSVTYSIISN